MKNLALFLIMIFIVLGASSAIAKEKQEEILWSDLNQQRYRGTAEMAITKMNVAVEVKRQWKDLIKTKRHAEIVLMDGMRFQELVINKKIIVRNVVFDAQGVEKAFLYTAGHGNYNYLLICSLTTGRWAWYREAIKPYELIDFSGPSELG
jgi:hypothetical protein